MRPNGHPADDSILLCLQFSVSCGAGPALIEIDQVESGHHVPYVAGVGDRWLLVFQNGPLVAADPSFLLDQLCHETNLVTRRYEYGLSVMATRFIIVLGSTGSRLHHHLLSSFAPSVVVMDCDRSRESSIAQALTLCRESIRFDELGPLVRTGITHCIGPIAACVPRTRRVHKAVLELRPRLL